MQNHKSGQQEDPRFSETLDWLRTNPFRGPEPYQNPLLR